MSNRKFGILLLVLGFLNLVDYFFTVRGLAMGATEINPFMDAAINAGSFGFIKVFLVPLGLVGIWFARNRIQQRRPFISKALWAVTIAYIGVTVVHIHGQLM